MAKTAPYPLATGTHSLLKTRTINRMAAPVTQTTPIAVPLGKIPGARGTSQDSVIFQDYHIE
jgi:hypothetical protein